MGITISELENTVNLIGTEKVPIVQNEKTKNVELSKIKEYMGIEDLKDKTENIENKITDTDWTTAILTSAFKAYQDREIGIPAYRKSGSIVEIKGIIAPTTDITDTGTLTEIFTLPERI